MTAIWAYLVAWFWSRTQTFWVFAAVCCGCFLLGGCVGCTFERVRPHWIFSTISPERSGN